MADVFPADQARIIRDLQDKVDQALTIAKTIPAIPITKASGPFVIPPGSPSPPQSGHVVLYAADGTLRVMNSSGQTFDLRPPEIPFVQGPAVDAPPVFNSPSNPQQTVQALHAAYQALRDDCQSGLRATLIALIQALRLSGIIAT